MENNKINTEWSFDRDRQFNGAGGAAILTSRIFQKVNDFLMHSGTGIGLIIIILKRLKWTAS